MEAISLENDQPQVEGGSAAIAMHSDPSYNFADRDAYEVGRAWGLVVDTSLCGWVGVWVWCVFGFHSSDFPFRCCSLLVPT